MFARSLNLNSNILRELFPFARCSTNYVGAAGGNNYAKGHKLCAERQKPNPCVEALIRKQKKDNQLLPDRLLVVVNSGQLPHTNGGKTHRGLFSCAAVTLTHCGFPKRPFMKIKSYHKDNYYKKKSSEQLYAVG